MTRATDDELLRPSLTADDDAVGFRSPWDPATLGWITLLVGPFGSGLLMLLNQRRLGLRGGWHLLLAMATLGTTIIVVLAFVIPSFGVEKSGDLRNVGSLVRFGGNVVALPMAWLMLREQRRRYRIAEQADVATGRLFWPGVVAWLVNLVIVIVVVAAAVVVKRL